jgi:hypothetical protein
MSEQKITVRDFIRQLGFTTGQENILAACFYAEFVEEKSDFSVTEVGDLLDGAKVPRPANLSRDLKVLAEKKHLNVVKGTSGSRVRYTLTNRGADLISDSMQAVGLTISKPIERTELLKEIAESLHPLIQLIPNQLEREYIEEAVSCLSPMNNAPRAAIVMGWAGTVYSLRRKIDQQGPAGYATFTSHWQKVNPKKFATTFNDLEDCSDANLLRFLREDGHN